MKTENLSALEIHKLSQEQYDREYDAGNIDETAIYLTTDDGTEQELTQTINEDSTSTQVPSAKAVFELISGVDSASLKYVENPNLWELNSGLYHIENGFYYKSDSQQTMTKGIMIISKKTDNLIYQIFQDEDIQYFGEIAIDGSDGSCIVKEFSKSAAIENPSDNTYLSETAIVNLFNEVKSAIPETLPADGGNADTVDGKHAEDFANAEHGHEQYALKTDVSSSTQTLQEAITQHTENTNIHVTLDEKAAWNNKSDFSGDYNDLNNKPSIPSIEGLVTETYVDEHKDNKENPHNVTTEQINAVPVTRKINNKELNSDIELTAEDVGADIAGTAQIKANEAVITANQYTDTVASGKSDIDHKHDESYDSKGSASTAEINAKTYAKNYADGKDVAIVEAKTAGDNAQTTANEAKQSASKVATDLATEITNRTNVDASHDSRLSELESTITGLSGAMHFRGVITTDPTTITSGYSNGDTVIYGNKEFVFNNGTFVEFGDATENANAISNLTTEVNKKANNSDLATVAKSGKYSDLSGTPTIPTKTSQLTNDSGFKTTDNNTTYTLTQDATDGHKITLTPSSGTPTTITIPDNNTTYSVVTQSTSGLMSNTDKTKLDGIATGANKTTVDSALSSTSTNPVQNKIINSALANKVDKVSGKGLSEDNFTTAEKNKLAGIASGANAYTHPTTAGNKHIPSGGSSGQILRWSSDGTAVWGADNNTTYSTATTSSTGLMSAADKTKLDGIATGANAYTHPTTSGNKHIPSGGSSGNILTYSADGTAKWGEYNNRLVDTRETNQTPEWYYTNYPHRVVNEFKSTSVIGLSGEMYCPLETVVPWSDASGGYPKQTAFVNNRKYTRVGTSNTTWGSWRTDTDTNTTYNVATSSTDGLTPKADASAGTISSQASQWVLTRNGTTVDWYKLPTNAFNNTTYSLGSFGITATASELNSLHPTADTTKTGYWLPTIIDVPENGELSEVLGGYITLPTNFGLIEGNTYTLEIWEDYTAAYGEAVDEDYNESLTLTCVNAKNIIGDSYAGMLLLVSEDDECYIYDKITINSNGEPAVGTGCAIMEAFTYFEEPYRLLIKGTFSGTPNLSKPSKLKSINANINGVARSAQSLTDCSYSGWEIANKLGYIDTINSNLSSSISNVSNSVAKKVGEKLSGYQYVNGVSTSTGTNAERLNDYRTRTSSNKIGNVATGQYSLAIGCGTTAAGNGSLSGGWFCNALGDYNFNIGQANTSNGSQSITIGGQLLGHGYQTVFGYSNKEFNNNDVISTGSNSIFIVGNGYYNSSSSSLIRTNAFRITQGGAVMGSQSFTASGADYAEYYEWADGNPNNEDRRGYFVTYENGDKIRIATDKDDYILGVISSRPAIIGNGYTDEWQGLYLTDVYGERLTETVEVEEQEIKDEEGNVIETIPAHTEVRFILNPEYDPEQEYIGRDQRPEWAVVGTHGQLVLIDNGTCTVNSYCTVGDDGTAIPTEKSEYRVIARLDDTHIRIVIK